MKEHLLQIKNLYQNNKYESALRQAKKLLNCAKEKHDAYYEAFANFHIGKIYWEFKNISESEEHLKKALQYFNKKEMFEKSAETKGILAIICHRTGKNEQAVSLFQENLEYYTKNDNTSQAVSSMANIATIFGRSEDFDYAISKYKECIEILKKYEDTYALGMTLFNLGEVYLHIKELDNAEKYLNKAVTVSKENHHTKIQARALDCLAGVSFYKSDLSTALKWELKANALLGKDTDLSLKTNIQLNISSILFEQDEYHQALKCLAALQASLKKLNDKSKWIKYYELKSNIEEKLEDFKSAYKTRLDSEKIFFEFFNTEKLRVIEEYKEKTEKLIIKIKNLEKEKELIKLKAKKELLDKDLTYKALQIVQKNELISSIMDLMKKLKNQNPENLKIINEIIELISLDNAYEGVWVEFEKWFLEVNKQFFYKLKKRIPGLTLRYRQLAAFIKLGLRSKEISLIMGISTESVEKYRYRMRKKLCLNKGESLFTFIDNL